MKFPLTILLALIAAPALAEEACYMPYSMFEALVPHIDLETCPDKAAASGGGFCRLGIEGETLRIYAFTPLGDDACLEGIESLPFADFVAKYGSRYARD